MTALGNPGVEPATFWLLARPGGGHPLRSDPSTPPDYANPGGCPIQTQLSPQSCDPQIWEPDKQGLIKEAVLEEREDGRYGQRLLHKHITHAVPSLSHCSCSCFFVALVVCFFYS